jgi:hypothetical protein
VKRPIFPDLPGALIVWLVEVALPDRKEVADQLGSPIGISTSGGHPTLGDSHHEDDPDVRLAHTGREVLGNEVIDYQVLLADFEPFRKVGEQWDREEDEGVDSGVLSARSGSYLASSTARPPIARASLVPTSS